MNANEKARQALETAILYLIYDDVLPAYGIASEVGRADIELPAAVSSAIEAALAALAEAAAVPPDVAGVVEPAIWISEGQLFAMGPDKDADSSGGRYLPIRRSEGGNFKFPLYSADALTSLAARLEEVERFGEWMKDRERKITTASAEAIARAEAAEKRLAEAGKVIAFYADKANWWNDETSVNQQELFDVPMGDDLGRAARDWQEAK